jgi:hypothetical protein
LQAQYRIAQELGVTLDVVRSMSIVEFHGWVEYLNFQNKQEKKAFDKARGKRRR